MTCGIDMDGNCLWEERLYYLYTFVAIDYFPSCSNFDNCEQIANRN